MENETANIKYYDSLVEQLKDVDTSKMPTNVDSDTSNKVIEKQKTFIWIRLYLKEEISDITIGDMFEMVYDDESLPCQFIAFGKTNMNRDYDNLVNYDPDDDEKQLCLMIDQDLLTSEVPFLRSLFRSTPYFQYQVYRRSELEFINQRTNDSYEYLDAEF